MRVWLARAVASLSFGVDFVYVAFAIPGDDHVAARLRFGQSTAPQVTLKPTVTLLVLEGDLLVLALLGLHVTGPDVRGTQAHGHSGVLVHQQVAVGVEAPACLRVKTTAPLERLVAGIIEFGGVLDEQQPLAQPGALQRGRLMDRQDFLRRDTFGVEQAIAGNRLAPPPASSPQAFRRAGRHPCGQPADTPVASPVAQVDARKFVFDVGGHGVAVTFRRLAHPRAGRAVCPGSLCPRGGARCP